MANVHKDSKLVFLHDTQNYKAMYRCECGVVKEIKTWDVKEGHIKSCGCYKKKIDVSRHTTHGLSKHPLYSTWKAMIDRCYTPHNKQFCDYGARGVIVCDEWRDDFLAYYKWALENGWEKGLHIDKDTKGDGLLYSPNTCCCILRKDNNRGKRDVVFFEYNGERNNLREWSIIYNIRYHLVWERVKRLGWDIGRALATPSDEYHKKRIVPKKE